MRSLTVCILALAACCAPTRGDRPTLPIVPYTPLGSAPGGRIAADGGQLTYGGLQRVSHTAAMVGYGTPSSLLDLRTDCAANETLVWSGAAWVCAAAPGDIGTGTAPDLAAWTGANTLGNYAGTGSVADKAISALSATGAATFSYFVDSGATGVTVSNNVASIDPTYTQRRVTGTCSDPFGIITIAQDGTVTCSTTTVGSSVGTANTFPIYTAARTLGNSPLIYDGSALISTLKNVQVGGSSAATLNLIDLAAAGVPANMPSGAAAMNIVQPGGAGLLISRPSASASSPRLSFYKTRSTDNTRVAVANGDPLGDIHFEGASDGTTDVQTAEIKASVTGTVASGSIPTGLFFYTGTTSAVQALSLNSDQTSTFGGQMDLGSHKIVNVTNGASAQDAAAFGQISSAVNAAVSGVSGRVGVFNGTNAITGYAGFLSDASGNVTTASLTVTGSAQVGATGNGVINIGGDTTLATNVQNGYHVNAFSDGNVYVDSKSNTGGTTVYRVGAGAQAGSSTTYETVTNSSGAVTWAAAQTMSSTAHIVGALTEDGNTTIGDATTDTLTVNAYAGFGVAPASTAQVFIDSSTRTYAVYAQSTPTGAGTALTGLLTPSAGTGQLRAVDAETGGTINTTGGALAAYGLFASVQTSRSSGANNLTNYGVYASVGGAQANYAIWTDAGEVRLNQTSGGAFLGGSLSVTGDSTVNKLTVNGKASDNSLTVNFTQTTQTLSLAALTESNTGTFNTTAGVLTSTGGSFSVTSTRSSGANNLTNRAAYFNASGAQLNKAIVTDNGDVEFNDISGTTTANGSFTAAVAASLNSVSGATTITGHDAANNVTISDATSSAAVGASVDLAVNDTKAFHGASAGSAYGVKINFIPTRDDSSGPAGGSYGLYIDASSATVPNVHAFKVNTGDTILQDLTVSGNMLADLNMNGHALSTVSTATLSGTLSGADATFSTTLAVTGATTLSGATTVKNDFFVATTGGTNKLKVLAATGHVNVLGTAITTGDLSSCGTTPAVATGSTDVAGRITEGTTATGCTLTFKNTWTNVPFCVCTGETSGVAAVLVGCHSTATTLVLENASASSDTYQYFCVGQSGGT